LARLAGARLRLDTWSATTGLWAEQIHDVFQAVAVFGKQGAKLRFEFNFLLKPAMTGPPRLVCGTELGAKVSFVIDVLVSQFCSVREVVVMNSIIYIVGAVVIALVILSFVGLV
jgi:hypothetical protein